MSTEDKSQEYYVVVMLNIMPPDSSYLHELYDLKGSTTGRMTKMEGSFLYFTEI